MGAVNIGGLLFADDLVILSDKAEHLQTMVARVFGVLVKRKLEVNWKKSAIMMVARNRRDVSGGFGRGMKTVGWKRLTSIGIWG